MQKKRFSITIPAHNGVAFLRVAIESALNQSRPADEVIVVDDASTDYTRDVVLGSDFKRYVKYFYCEKSKGFVDAWNRAITKATGDFVTILHQTTYFTRTIFPM